MNIIQITPGAGGMYCGNCFRDNALVRALRQKGHHALMVPLYLPMTLDEADQSAGTPLFFGGINVYLEQKIPWFRRVPRWLTHLLDHPRLLRWAAGRAAKTRAADVGELTLSMFRGEEGNQARELQELVGWLKTEKPQVVALSNALLAGMARQLKHELRVPVVCFLQGEDSFLDELPVSHRDRAWQLLRERAEEIDLFIAPTEYFGNLMRDRLRLPPHKVRVIHNGMNLTGYAAAEPEQDPPVLGYFARLCREKGLDTVVEAFLQLKNQEAFRGLRLHVGGSLGPSDRLFVDSLRRRVKERGWAADFQVFPNVSRDDKITFLKSLSVFSVPARYGEAFGLYVIEALASGIPVVQPRAASFPELIEATGGGLLCAPEDPVALAEAIASLLRNPKQRQELARRGREAALGQFSVERMTERVVEVFAELLGSVRAGVGEPGPKVNPVSR